MKTTILIIWAVLSFTSFFAQQKGINLKKVGSEKSLFINENTRVRLKTISGKIIAGKFQIVNDSIIIIDEKQIQLNEIAKIRKQSTFSAIIRPISITLGTVFIVASVFAIDSGGYGPLLAVLLVPPGIPLIIAPFIKNNHPNRKWTCEIRSR